MVNSSSTMLPRIYNRERTIFLINNAGKIGYSHANEWNFTFVLYYTHKIKQKSKKLNIRPKTVKLFEENVEEKHHDFGLGNDLLAMTWKHRQWKIDKLDQ